MDDCGNHDWRESMANPFINWCSKCRQRRLSAKGDWVKLPMSAPIHQQYGEHLLT